MSTCRADDGGGGCQPPTCSCPGCCQRTEGGRRLSPCRQGGRCPRAESVHAQRLHVQAHPRQEQSGCGPREKERHCPVCVRGGQHAGPLTCSAGGLCPPGSTAAGSSGSSSRCPREGSRATRGVQTRCPEGPGRAGQRAAGSHMHGLADPRGSRVLRLGAATRAGRQAHCLPIASLALVRPRSQARGTSSFGQSCCSRGPACLPASLPVG